MVDHFNGTMMTGDTLHITTVQTLQTSDLFLRWEAAILPGYQVSRTQILK